MTVGRFQIQTATFFRGLGHVAMAATCGWNQILSTAEVPAKVH